MGRMSAELNSLISGMNKKYGAGVVMGNGKGIPDDVERVIVDSPKLGRVFGNGGVPLGRIVEFYGMESSGKTSICEYCAGQFQKRKFHHVFPDKKAVDRYGVVAFIDMEHAFDKAHAENLGFDIGKALLAQPDTGDDAFQIAKDFAESGEVDLIIIDSVDACVPSQMVDGDMEQQTVGLQARLVGKFIRAVQGSLARNKCTLFCINQFRASISPYTPQTITGGNAIKFYASVRVETARKDWILGLDGKTVTGIQIRVKNTKNKTATPYVMELVNMRFDTGMDVLSEWIDLAVKEGVIDKGGGGFFTLPNGERVRGVDNLRKKLLSPECKSVYDDIIEKTRAVVASTEAGKGKRVSVDSEEDSVGGEPVDDCSHDEDSVPDVDKEPEGDFQAGGSEIPESDGSPDVEGDAPQDTENA